MVLKAGIGAWEIDWGFWAPCSGKHCKTLKSLGKCAYKLLLFFSCRIKNERSTKIFLFHKGSSFNNQKRQFKGIVQAAGFNWLTWSAGGRIKLELLDFIMGPFYLQTNEGKRQRLHGRARSRMHRRLRKSPSDFQHLSAALTGNSKSASPFISSVSWTGNILREFIFNLVLWCNGLLGKESLQTQRVRFFGKIITWVQSLVSQSYFAVHASCFIMPFWTLLVA